jgi:hypothetical protein
VTVRHPRLLLAFFTVLIALLSAGPPAEARPKKGKGNKARVTAEQKQADRHFKNGVALYQERKFTEALAEFERAHEIAPHPLVLYNIATTYRELSRYAEAVRTYQRFLEEAQGVAAPARIDAARFELEEILGRVARVKIDVRPGEATVEINGEPVVLDDMPLFLSPGEHRITVQAGGHAPDQRTLRVASGDELHLALELEPVREVAGPEEPSATLVGGASPVAPSPPRRMALSASFGTNLRRAGDTGAPGLGGALALGSRLELGLDVLLVAYAAVPSARLRLAGDQVAVHLVAAVPIAFPGEGAGPFVAGAAGLALRVRATDRLALRLESWASYAGSDRGTTLPAFVGGELWF